MLGHCWPTGKCYWGWYFCTTFVKGHYTFLFVDHSKTVNTNGLKLAIYFNGREIEDAEHYLKNCVLYERLRRRARDIFNIDLRFYETEELLEGDPNQENQINSELFKAVQWFIGDSERFR